MHADSSSVRHRTSTAARDTSRPAVSGTPDPALQGLRSGLSLLAAVFFAALGLIAFVLPHGHDPQIDGLPPDIDAAPPASLDGTAAQVGEPAQELVALRAEAARAGTAMAAASVAGGRAQP